VECCAKGTSAIVAGVASVGWRDPRQAVRLKGALVPRGDRQLADEAARWRAQGWTYKQIAEEWQQQHGFNARVAFRLAHGLTQQGVADRWNERWPSDTDSPKTAKHLAYWEAWPDASGRTPSLDTLNRLACIYQCSAGDLLGGEDHSGLDPNSPRGEHARAGVACPSHT
jgi:transcriptional regulator with XRE-family HTH domain